MPPPPISILYSQTDTIWFICPCHLSKILGEKIKSNHQGDSSTSHQNKQQQVWLQMIDENDTNVVIAIGLKYLKLVHFICKPKFM